MPVLTSTNDLRQTALPTNGYGCSAIRLDDLGAAEYTLVSIVCDASGSVAAFQGELENALKSIVEACQLSPRADNFLLRLISFDDALQELHGFKLLERCNLTDYDGVPRIGGSTALYDAAEALGGDYLLLHPVFTPAPILGAASWLCRPGPLLGKLPPKERHAHPISAR